MSRTADELIKVVGGSGFPLVVDPSVKDTWDLYLKEESPEDHTERVRVVLGFFHLLRQAGMKALINGNYNPQVFYKQIRLENFEEQARGIATVLRRTHLLHYLRVFKTSFNMSTPTRGDLRMLRVDLCLIPAKKVPLDQILPALHSTLYHGDLPHALKARWSKTAKPKSLLPRSTALMKSHSTIGFLPIYADAWTSVLVRRAADEALVLRVICTVEARSVPWLTPRQHTDLLRALFAKAFSKIKG